MSVPIMFLSQLFIRKSFVFTGDVLIIYDYLITFPLEVEYIWNAPWTVAKTGFLINRYGNLIGQTFIMLEETGYVNHSSRKFCAIFEVFCTFFMILSGESIRILVLMRVWAIWGCTYRVTIFLVTLHIFYVLALIGSAIYPQISTGSIPYMYLQQVGVCIVPISSHVWLTWCATLILDSIVLAMVWRGLRERIRESRGLCTSVLVHLLLRDAVLFYATKSFVSVSGIICWTTFKFDPRNFLHLAISSPMLSIIGQRLILNLKRLQARPPFITRLDVSREVDRQMAMIILDDDDGGDHIWPECDLEANVGRTVGPGHHHDGPSASEYDSKTSPSYTRGTVTKGSDIEFVGTEVPCDQGTQWDG